MLAVAAVAALHQQRPARASSCAPGATTTLKLVRVTEDGVPITGHYDARVRMYGRLGGIDIVAYPNAGSGADASD